MIQYVVLAGLISVSINAAKIPRLDGRIVGGVNVTIEDYPYQVSIQCVRQHMCGGSIISKDFVVTAAHCTQGLNPLLLTVRVGTSTLGRDGEVHQVSQIFPNPLFDIDSMDYDISILQLEIPLDFSDSVQPIPLTETNEIDAGTSLTVSGWGTMQEDGLPSSQLQAVDVPYVDIESCQLAYEGTAVTERMICAGNSAKDSCQGDSGGPLVKDGVLVGIVSWGLGCARPHHPGVYTSVSELRGFIKNITNL